MNTIFFDNLGNIVQTCSFETTAGAQGNTYSFIYTEVNDVRPDTHYVLDGKLLEKPSKPSEHYIWDSDTHIWRLSREALAKDLKAKLNGEFSKRTWAPIEYTSLFDADPLARERINSVLSRIARTNTLPEGWVGWRDYHNNTHWSTLSASEVFIELSALATAIEDREQQLLIKYWQHKANIEVATDEELLNYDITQGW